MTTFGVVSLKTCNTTFFMYCADSLDLPIQQLKLRSNVRTQNQRLDLSDLRLSKSSTDGQIQRQRLFYRWFPCVAQRALISFLLASTQMLLIFGVLTLVSTCFAEFHHNQFRQYTCFATVPGEPADCTLRFKEGDNERTTINDSGCFTEKDNERDQLLTYCPLQCPDAESAYVLLKRPSNNNKCVTFFSYNVVRRRNDWFLWRSGKCLSEEIQFDIGCTFPFKQIKPNPKFVKKDH